MASAILGDELLCSICLNTFGDPVTLRCGHNFCRDCIDQFLKTQDESGVYSCPQCREEFQERPALMRNINLHNVAERLLSTRPHEKVTGICCTYCIHSPVPAVKSCLLCEASLCDDHLKVHSKSPEHVLTEPRTSLENRKCSVHNKIVEYYCTEDAACICVYCSAGEHRGHQVEKLDEALNNKNMRLGNVFQKLITVREKTEERVRSLEERWRKAQEKASGEAERVTTLFIDMRRRLDDLEKKVLSEISRQEVQVSLSLSDVIHQLEIKKDELSRKIRHIEELFNMMDPLTVLQEPDTGDLCDPEEGGGDEDTGGHDKTHEVDVEGITRMVHEGFSDIMKYLQTILPAKPKQMRSQPPSVRSLPRHTQASPLSGTEYGGDGVIVQTGGAAGEVMDAGKVRQGQLVLLSNVIQDLEEELSRKIMHIQDLHSSGKKYVIVRTDGAGGEGAAAGKGTIYGQDPADILLDVNTAANNVLISDDLKTATGTKITQNRPETRERFEGYQVMSSRRFSSGRHYWDVEISGSGVWRVGMCYPSIDRRGRQSYLGYNNKSWSLCREQGLFSMFYKNYSVTHGSKWIQLRHQITSNRVRICLDYEAGRLSFYELCEPIIHLHTFTTTFTEPLHAVLYVENDSVKISGRQRI